MSCSVIAGPVAGVRAGWVDDVRAHDPRSNEQDKAGGLHRGGGGKRRLLVAETQLGSGGVRVHAPRVRIFASRNGPIPPSGSKGVGSWCSY